MKACRTSGKGAMQQENEVRLGLQVIGQRAEDLTRAIRELHPLRSS